MKKVLLVGANSYIANSFCDFIGRSMLVDKISASNDEWIDFDFNGFDTVVMLAAIVHKKEKLNMEDIYKKVNCDLPVLIAKKAKSSGVKHFIFFSTAAVYGSNVSRVTTMTKEKPDTFYGKYKLEAEKQLNTLIESNKFKLTILRPPMVYGDNCKGNYQTLKKYSKLFFVFPKVSNMRSMIHINKMCECLENIIINELTGIVIPQDDNYIETSELVKQIRGQMNKKTLLVPGVDWLIKKVSKRSKIMNKIFGDFYFDTECK